MDILAASARCLIERGCTSLIVKTILTRVPEYTQMWHKTTTDV